MSSRSDLRNPVFPVLALLLAVALVLGAMGLWGGGWGGAAMMGFGPLFMLVPLLLLVALIYALTQRNEERKEDARDVLERRYAQGEMTREEYLQKRDDLSGRAR